jgi:outer membrane biosynthesis protein TonB
LSTTAQAKGNNSLFVLENRDFSFKSSRWSYVLMIIAWSLASIAPSFADGAILKGGVNEQEYLPGRSAPSLSRQDISRTNDPFASGQATDDLGIDQLSAPLAENVSVRSARPPSPPVDLSASKTNASDFDGESMSASLDNGPTAMADPGQVPFPLAAQEAGSSAGANVANVDDSADMQIAWDQWHRRVAAAIYQRFETMAHMAFKHSGPLAAYVSYTISNDGRIVNVRLQQRSNNAAFNTLVLLVINSLAAQPDLLHFPTGSHRMTVDKSGMFTQNYGQQGFRYTTGDRETVRK